LLPIDLLINFLKITQMGDLFTDWCYFRDFKKQSHFTNTNYFNSDTTPRILNHFSGGLTDLKTACKKNKGCGATGSGL
jgi:hypothetical protein